MPHFFHLFSKDDKKASLDEFAENQWSCRGCGTTNHPIRYKCCECTPSFMGAKSEGNLCTVLCNSFSLCYECHKTPREYHSKHSPHNFALVIESENNWLCNNCDAGDASIRIKCRKCPDVDFCENCYNDNELSQLHPEHPKDNDFSWTIYSDAAWECEGCESPNGDLSFRCTSCRDLVLCPKCVEQAGQHHKMHPSVSDYTPVLALTRSWTCDGCEKSDTELNDKKRAGIRWDCKYCKDTSLCVKCFKKPEKKHKKHPNQEDYTPVLYPALYTPSEDSD